MTAEKIRDLPALPALETIRRVHIIGICGTAMGSLAAMFKARGFQVTGSDTMAYPPMSTWLEERGLTIMSGYAAAHVGPDVDLVIVGNVSRASNPEAEETLRRGIPYLSLPEALRVFFFPSNTVLVATGTHGKTTTSSMASWILHQTGRDPSFFIGGVTGNFQSNFRLGAGGWWVVEGDEYDTAYFDKVPKYWHYPAKFATINNVEFDHADIYPDLASIRHVFSRFAQQLPANGRLWVGGDDETALACASTGSAAIRTFGFGARCDWRAEILGVDADGTHTRVYADGRMLEVQLPTIGDYNVRNFLGAAGLASETGVSLEQSAEAIASFISTRKRQEIKGIVEGIVVIDDFAHHPTAVRATIEAIRARFPDRKIWAIFEAKSNTSRRAVFQHDYPPAFASADHVVLSSPWKEDNLPPEDRISIPRMTEDIERLGKPVSLIPEVDDIVQYVGEHAQPGDIIAGLSGSAFGGLHDKLLAHLRRRFGITQ